MTETLNSTNETAPEVWQTETVKSVCVEPNGVQTGPFGSQLHQSDYVSHGTPIVTVEHLGENRLIGSPPLVSDEDAHRLSKYSLKSGDIVFSRVGSVDRRALVREQEDGWLFSGRCLRMRPNPKRIDPLYLSMYFGLSSVKEYIRQIAVGATMPSLNTALLSGVNVTVPPLPEQRAIAHVLGALDDKIEINRRMNATLETLTQTLFRSWFVDFDPVMAKAGGRTPDGMDAETAGLFPDAFEESVLGPVPKGWKVEPLDKIAAFLNGLPLQKFPPRDESSDLPVIKIAQLRRGTSEGSDRANNDVPAPFIVDDSDVLFSWSGSLEVEVWCGGKGALNQHLFKVTSDKFPKWFYFYWLRHFLPHFQSIAASKATTMGHIQRHHLTEAKVTVPTHQIIQAADLVFAPLLAQMMNNRIEVRNLAYLRDELLPKLISGEVRLPDAMVADFAEAKA